MGRLATPGFQRFQQAMPGSLDVTFAGAEVNVAASLASLGARAAFVTALPLHAVADAVVATLRGLGIDTAHLVRTPQGRLGLYFFEKGVNQRPASVIYDREGSSLSLLPPQAYDWASIFDGASWFHLSGVTPALSQNAAAVALHAVQQASARGLHVSFDMNFRTRLWQWDPATPPRELAARTVRELLPHVDLFFGGPDDVALLTEKPVTVPAGGDLRVGAARQLAAHFPRLSRVAMTLRRTHSASHHDLGGMLYQRDAGLAFHTPLRDGQPGDYAITSIVDRLGGGDAFAAGLIFALTTPALSTPQIALNFATAASCLAHSIDGDFNLTNRAEVEALMNTGNPGAVGR